jgi:transcription-repair coupling factor (superfamily II helicase)
VLDNPPVVPPPRASASGDESTLEQITARLRGPEPRVDLAGISCAARGLLIRHLLQRGLGPVVAVAVDEEAADGLERDLRFFLQHAGERVEQPTVLRLPQDAVLPYDDLSPDRLLELDRLRALFVLGHHRLGRRPAVLVVSVQSLLRLQVPRARLLEATELLGKGATVDRDELATRLTALGYARVPLVEDAGTFAVRGGVVDVFPPLYDRPARLEFFGDEVESVRLFDPQTQRTLEDLPELLVSPAREILFDAQTIRSASEAAREAGDHVNLPSTKLRAFLEQIEQQNHVLGIEALLPAFHAGALEPLSAYLPKDALYFLDGPAEIAREGSELWERLERGFEDAQKRSEIALPPDAHYARPDTALQAERVLRSHHLYVGEEQPLRLPWSSTGALRAAILSHHGEEGALTPLQERLEDLRDRGIAAVIACHTSGQAERLKRLLLDRRLMVKLHAEPFGDAPDRLFDPAVHAHLFAGEVSGGFQSDSELLAVISDEEVFGPRSARRTTRRTKSELLPFIDAFKELNEGDLVVHVDHGIGRYMGLTRMSIRGVDGDFLLLHYDGQDKLYLPVGKLRLVQKFSGADPSRVALDRLGGQSWIRTKRKVKDHLLQMAAELLEVYAARQAHQGHAFSSPDPYFRQFEEDFPFEETPDQDRAISDVVGDMTSGRPMDRLVCGDVGFGKTEVAMRAAFKAVQDKKQVAVLVPTTLLSSQHFRTFRERFKDYPVTVEMLSRLRSTDESRDILARLRQGRIDVMIGTHRLLGKDVEFQDLGLVVVDEEQRFGVTHKERLKKLRKTVDVLTLTATPIPRTLHQSLSGIRDLSIIATPPADRRAIRTFVLKFEPEPVREAIEREVARGGQVFFVHNRVRSIPAVEHYLQKLCPQIRFGIAHGQMEEHKLDHVMADFIERKFEVLICSSIIEAGLDIPTANTIIVNRADTFGLSQLYQIRGRVGRSRERAYAYLTIPGRRPITRDAQKRLQALQDFSDLGSGFRIASQDLEIRGAGNLLGPEQSGQIAAIGFDLYTQLLEEAVHEIRGEPLREQIEPDVTLPVSALLPETYVPDVHQRLLYYKKLAQAQSDEELDDVRGELRDVCGELPDEVEALVDLASLRIAMRELRLRGLDLGPGRLVLSMGNDAAVSAEKLAHKVARSGGAWRLTPEMKLVAKLPGPPEAIVGRELIRAGHDLVRQVAKLG